MQWHYINSVALYDDENSSNRYQVIQIYSYLHESGFTCAYAITITSKVRRFDCDRSTFGKNVTAYNITDRGAETSGQLKYLDDPEEGKRTRESAQRPARSLIAGQTIKYEAECRSIVSARLLCCLMRTTMNVMIAGRLVKQTNPSQLRSSG